MNSAEYKSEAIRNGLLSALSLSISVNAFVFGYLLYLEESGWFLPCYTVGIVLLAIAAIHLLWMLDSKHAADRELYWERKDRESKLFNTRL